MKLTVLGKYGPYPNKVNGKTSGYLLQSNNSNVILDLGCGTLNNLVKFIDVKDVNFIILSHLHFDHVSDMGVLSYALSFAGKKDKVNVYLPFDNSPIYSLLKSISCFNLINVEENKEYVDSGLRFEFYKMQHPVTSFGVKIKGDNVFAYTGDTTFNCNLKNLVNGADLVLADGAFLQKDFNTSKPHMSVLEACGLTNYFDGKVIVTHINPNYKDSDVLKEILSVTNRAEVAIEEKTYIF